MKLYFLPKAIGDLKEIGDYIASDNPRRALTFIEEIEQRCETLVCNPLIGISRDDLTPDLRSVSFKKYLIFYRVRNGGVFIARVIHGSRDYLNDENFP